MQRRERWKRSLFYFQRLGMTFFFFLNLTFISFIDFSTCLCLIHSYGQTDCHSHKNTHGSSNTPIPWSTDRCSQMSYKEWKTATWAECSGMVLLENLPAHRMPLCSSDQTGASRNSPPLPLSDMTGECHNKDLIISETRNQSVLWGQCWQKKRTLQANGWS